MAKQWKDMDKQERKIFCVILFILIGLLIYIFFPRHHQ
jgi:hypothetical protein